MSSLHHFGRTRIITTVSRSIKRRVASQYPQDIPSRTSCHAIPKPRSRCSHPSINRIHKSPLVTLQESLELLGIHSWASEVSELDRRRTVFLTNLSRGTSTGIVFPKIVARYLTSIHSQLERGSLSEGTIDNVLLEVFDDAALAYLSWKGYSVGDVMAWAWILATPSAYRSAIRYVEFEQSILTRSPEARHVPVFILLFVLRRRDIDPSALQLLLKQSWKLICNSPTFHRKSPRPASSNKTWNRGGDNKTINLIFSRLIRNALKVSPATLVPIAQMITTFYNRDLAVKDLDQLDLRDVRDLTNIYNQFIESFSQYCSVEPYHSSRIQQTAIFHILREMRTFNPPLALTRSSYQAITKILLASQKSKSEKQWARFKAASWPPWKEDKLGIDAGRLEGSKSKSMESISQMTQAGYASTSWDQVASILAGWDVDGTPTIQTRTILPTPRSDSTFPGDPAPVKHSSRKGYLGILPTSVPTPPPSEPNETQKMAECYIWAARIRATRTIREAWACFLSFQEQNLAPTQEIYIEIAEKLVFADQKQEFFPSEASNTVPGDGKEIFAEPSSLRDVIYVHTEPPKLESFIRQMASSGVKIPNRILTLLLSRTTSIETGLEYLTYSQLTVDQIQALTTNYTVVVNNRQESLASIRDSIFASFIQFLCKNAAAHSSTEKDLNLRFRTTFPVILLPSLPDDPSQQSRTVVAEQALAHATYLLRICLPRYMPTWHGFLLALSTGKRVRDCGFRTSTQRVVAWREALDVVQWMQQSHITLDLKCIENLAHMLTKVILSCQRDNHGAIEGLAMIDHIRAHEPHPLEVWPSTLEGIIQDGVRVIKSHLYYLLPLNGLKKPNTSYDAMLFNPPKLATLPSPAVIHALVRVFGFSADIPALLKVLQMVAGHPDEFKRTSTVRLGGPRMLRRSVVATRAFLEGHLVGMQDLGSGADDARPRIHPLTQEARELIDNSEILSPWPTDEELVKYSRQKMLMDTHGTGP
ncbi:hypothetical protein FQN57_000378 [Myotisia sp. PD_48]|nr:hypothetical protein FQN57_000378 [Myotisia sp. PD_48]